MRIIVITIMVIVIIITISVPGMILSLWDMSAIGLWNKAHCCFGRENGFWIERMKKETVRKKRESQKTERPGEAEPQEGRGKEEACWERTAGQGALSC